MSSTFGRLFAVTTFGESHGPAVGVVVDGMPPGIAVDADFLQRELDRRRPGQSALTTQRSEADRVEILSGVFEGKSLGTPIAMLVRNTDAKSKDYDALRDVYPPRSRRSGLRRRSTAMRDHRGGGRVVRPRDRGPGGRRRAGQAGTRHGRGDRRRRHGAGGRGACRTPRLGSGRAEPGALPRRGGRRRRWRRSSKPRATRRIRSGGVVEIVARGVPAGWGDPTMDKLDALLGGGDAVDSRDQGGRDRRRLRDVRARADRRPTTCSTTDSFVTNHAGGIAGGISNGADVVVRVAVRPATSIGKPQTAGTREGGTHDDRDRRPTRSLHLPARGAGRREHDGDHAGRRLVAAARGSRPRPLSPSPPC